ncbi:hypothetical protein PT974_07896 [Cladobotryum mycophilum]|uniref:Endonuclease/exonuclease/phosphatase domain-containing protein n=1 Tax=Cladobotryum mycophilum TaxID=491253 RepID=A0ABR0SCS9_9HYPO
MLPVLGQCSRRCMALSVLRGASSFTSSQKNSTLTNLSQPYLSFQISCRRSGGYMTRGWASQSRGKRKDSSAILPEHTIRSLLDSMERELARRGDFRELDDLSDHEFNDLFLEVESGDLEKVVPIDFNEPKSRPFINKRIKPTFLKPQVYDLPSSTWKPFKNSTEILKRNEILKIASWNLFFDPLGLEARTSAALTHLRAMFGQDPQKLVVMFQELRQESLETILNDKWAQQNFVLSDEKAPCLPRGNGQPSRYFTLMMVSRTLPISNCFRIPFDSNMMRDALVVDIPVGESTDARKTKESLRLCTTHLESLHEGKRYRLPQLSVVSSLLKGKLSNGQRICGGLVGGDMNSVDSSEQKIHQAPEVGLKDVWEDEPPPSSPVRKSFQKDPTYGRAKGNTWGYQSDGAKSRKRLDKFLYTGSIETVALGEEAQDVTGRLGRFGIGLKTRVGVDDIWVSDHFGITIGIKIT